jgi:hypothetical protein
LNNSCILVAQTQQMQTAERVSAQDLSDNYVFQRSVLAYVEAASLGDGVTDLGNIRVVSGLGVRADLSDTFLRSRVEAGFIFPAIKQAGDSVKPFYLLIGDYHPIYDI